MSKREVAAIAVSLAVVTVIVRMVMLGFGQATRYEERQQAQLQTELAAPETLNHVMITPNLERFVITKGPFVCFRSVNTNGKQVTYSVPDCHQLRTISPAYFEAYYGAEYAYLISP